MRTKWLIYDILITAAGLMNYALIFIGEPSGFEPIQFVIGTFAIFVGFPFTAYKEPLKTSDKRSKEEG